MGVPYSLDLRERVVAAVASGMSRRGAAKLYKVSYLTVINGRALSVANGAAQQPFRWGVKRRFGLCGRVRDWIQRRLADKTRT